MTETLKKTFAAVATVLPLPGNFSVKSKKLVDAAGGPWPKQQPKTMTGRL